MLGQRDAEHDHRLAADVGDHPRRHARRSSTRSSSASGIDVGAEPADAGGPLVAVVDDRTLHAERLRAGSLAACGVAGLAAQRALDDLGVGVGGLAAGRVALLDEVRAHQPVGRDGEERRQGSEPSVKMSRMRRRRPTAARAPEPAADGAVAARPGAAAERRRRVGVVADRAASSAAGAGACRRSARRRRRRGRREPSSVAGRPAHVTPAGSRGRAR